MKKTTKKLLVLGTLATAFFAVCKKIENEAMLNNSDTNENASLVEPEETTEPTEATSEESTDSETTAQNN